MSWKIVLINIFSVLVEIGTLTTSLTFCIFKREIYVDQRKEECSLRISLKNEFTCLSRSSALFSSQQLVLTQTQIFRNVSKATREMCTISSLFLFVFVPHF